MQSHLFANRYLASVCAFVVLAIGLVAPGRVDAQVAGATLTGTVTDPSSAAIPKAQLTITDVATGVTREVETDSAGFYSAPNLLPGNYDVKVTAPGFNTSVQKGITLTVGAPQVLDFRMQVGVVSQTVEVQTEAVAVELTSSAVKEDVNPTSVRELPLNGRDWIQLATLQPGIATTRTQASGSSGNANRGSRGYGNQFSGSGHRPYENNFRINGITVNDYANGAPGSVIGGALGVDAIQEFSVLTTNYTAEYGRTTGAIINAITKSGTNSFHGDAYYFMRDEGLDARNYFDPVKIPPFHRNQFGVSGGVPIRKDKTFVFGDYETIRQAKSLTFSDTVPSPAARGIGANGQPTVAVVGGVPLPGPGQPGAAPNPDPVTHIDQAVTPYLGFWPLPNAGLISADAGIFNGAGLSTFNENYGSARLDQVFSAKDSFASSFYVDRAYFSQPDSLLAVLNASATKRSMISLEETHIFSATFVNTGRIGFSRSVGQQNIPVSALNPLAGETSLGVGGGAYAPTINPVPGFTPIQGGLGQSSPGTNTDNSYQGYDDAFLTRGVHTFKFGFAVERIQQNATRSSTQPGGRFTFGSLTGFYLNQPTSFLVSAQNSVFGKAVGIRQTAFGAYIADDWRIRPNLTLNLGLRYEPVTLPTEAHGGFGVLKNIYSGTEQIPVTNLWSRNQTLRNFEPRVGFAWDPFHDGKTAVRGGFGIFDMLPLPWVYYFNTSSSLPFTLQTSVTNTTPVNPLVQGDFPLGASAKAGFDLSKAQTRAVEQNPKANYAMNWNLNVQRQIGSLLVMIGYVGSHYVHQAYTPDDVDMVLPTVTPAGFLWPCGPPLDSSGNCTTGHGTRLNPLVGPTKFTMWDGSGRYESLQTQVTKRMSHGLQAQLSYTWGKCFDQGSGAQLGDPFQNSLSTFLFFSPVLREGLCDYNVTHTLVANYIWDIPKPKIQSAIAGQVLGGWEVGGIVTFTSGSPFTLVMGGDPLGVNTGGDPKDWPDRIGSAACANPTTSDPRHYLNLSCFSPPTLPSGISAASLPFPCNPGPPSVTAAFPNACLNLFGDNARNSLIGPNLTDFDFSLFKNTYLSKISETFNIQFRAEFFNVLNHPNFQPPFDNNTAFNANGTPIASLGKIDITATDNRQIQLGLKLIW
jgi:hypothetical protein